MIARGDGVDSGPTRPRGQRQRHVVVASLNTAWETRFLAPGWRRGSVTRAVDSSTFPGGKPLNVIRLCISMGVPVELVALADAGLADRLSSLCTAAGVPVDLIVSQAPSRSTTAVIDERGRATVLNGEGQTPGADELTRCIRALGERTGPGDVLVVAGSFPMQVPDGLLSQLSLLADERKARFLLDTSGSQLDSGLRLGPDIVKVNERELAAVRPTGGPLGWSRDLGALTGPRNLVVTAGRRGLRARDETGRQWIVRPPTVESVNTVGVGDALAAGMAAKLAAGGEFLEALVAGTAWAAARAERFDLAISPERVADLARRTRVQVA
jgi:fructose-1-phosphate kinase PfkB-like protein